MNERATRLAAENTELVYRAAHVFCRRLPRSVDRDEVVGDGMIGLMQAAHRFSHDHGVPFAGFAWPRILGEMRDGLTRRRKGAGVTVSLETPSGGQTLGDTLAAAGGDVLESIVSLERLRAGPEAKAAPVLRGRPLTGRELQILVGGAYGESISETAKRIYLGVETVKTHRRVIRAKLGAATMIQAVYIARREIEDSVNSLSTDERSEVKAPALVCPECGRLFANPRGLGAHRRYIHGVAGVSRR